MKVQADILPKAFTIMANPNATPKKKETQQVDISSGSFFENWIVPDYQDYQITPSGAIAISRPDPFGLIMKASPLEAL